MTAGTYEASINIKHISTSPKARKVLTLAEAEVSYRQSGSNYHLMGQGRTRGILESAGWSEVRIEPFDIDMMLGGATSEHQ